MKVLVVKYIILIKIYVNEYKVHLASIFFKLAQLPIQMIMYLFLWAFISRTSEVDYDYMIFYYLMTGLLGLAYPFLHISMEIQKDVLEGGISNALVRPYPYIMPYLCKYLAWMCIYSLVYIPVLIIILIFRDISALNIIFFALESFVGMFVEFMTWFSIGLIALYIERIRGVVRIIAALKAIVSGSLIPLYIMPDGLEKFAALFPFKYYIYVPVNNLLNGIGISGNLYSLSIGIMWIFLLSIIASILWKQGKKRIQINVS